jgi:diguanylate cyclase (GGDEF)-like protein/PAS domain S-box-containing protein
VIGSRGGDGRDAPPGLGAYRAIYANSPDGILFTSPDGRVLAANPAACEIFGMSEAEICARGRQGLADHTDDRWPPLLAERERTGVARGVARMLRGDGGVIEVEMSAQIFTDADGAKRTCTVLRDVSKRLAMEQELRELALTDDLTGLKNRRGFVTVGSHMLDVADRQICTAHLLFVDVDNMKVLNDRHGHGHGDAGLRAVARALTEAMRRADVLARIGGDEFVGLALDLDHSDRKAIERRIHQSLSSASTRTVVGQTVEVSVGWAQRGPGQATSVEQLLLDADHAMYQAKVAKRDRMGLGSRS